MVKKLILALLIIATMAASSSAARTYQEICPTCNWYLDGEHMQSMGRWLNASSHYDGWRPERFGEVRLGDVCLFKTSRDYWRFYDHPPEWRGLIIHRVVGIDLASQTYIFKGDNNGWWYDPEHIPQKKIWLCLEDPHLEEWK